MKELNCFSVGRDLEISEGIGMTLIKNPPELESLGLVLELGDTARFYSQAKQIKIERQGSLLPQLRDSGEEYLRLYKAGVHTWTPGNVQQSRFITSEPTADQKLKLIESKGHIKLHLDEDTVFVAVHADRSNEFMDSNSTEISRGRHLTGCDKLWVMSPGAAIQIKVNQKVEVLHYDGEGLRLMSVQEYLGEAKATLAYDPADYLPAAPQKTELTRVVIVDIDQVNAIATTMQEAAIELEASEPVANEPLPEPPMPEPALPGWSEVDTTPEPQEVAV